MTCKECGNQDSHDGRGVPGTADDGVHRELIDGEVREFGMTKLATRTISEVEANFVFALKLWQATTSEPRGKLLRRSRLPSRRHEGDARRD